MRDGTNGTQEPSAACGSACGCDATGIANRTRWVIGAVVLVAAAALVVRAVVLDKSEDRKAKTGFMVAPVAGAAVRPDKDSFATTIETTPLTDAVIGKGIATLAELNLAATNTDAVFVYFPGKSALTNRPPVAEISGATKVVSTQGIKVGVFTLNPGSSDYEGIASQMMVPGVLTMVKGRGAVPVTGDITVEKLVQSFVAASSASSGGCGAGGCGPAGGCK